MFEALVAADRAEGAWDERPRADPGLASLELVDMAVPAEDGFAIRIPREHGPCFETVDGAADCVRRATAAAHRPAGAEPAPAQEESR
jgi:acyl carrier protein